MSKDPFFEREDKKFFEKWLELSKQGSANAIYMVAECFYTGKGTYQNVDEAAKWYKLAADGGDLTAQARLNEMFDKGEISELYKPQPYVSPKKISTQFPKPKKKSPTSKKIYDGNLGEVDPELAALYNNEKFGYEENTFKESYGKKRKSNKHELDDNFDYEFDED